MPTLYDVAMLAGVSTATVSHVLNNSRRVTRETREKVERAISQLDFVPNPVGRMLAQRKHTARARQSPDKMRVLTAMTTKTGTSGKAKAVRRRNGEGEPVPNASTELRNPTPQADTSGLARDNMRSLLKIIRATQPISRADLARRLRINRSTVTEIVKPLLATGVLRERDSAQPSFGRVGRPPVGLLLGTDQIYFIAVSIGVTSVQVGLATSEGSVIEREALDTLPTPTATLARINAVINRYRATIPGRALPFIGVSVPGPTDANRTRLLYAPHLGWRDVALADMLRRGGDGPGRSHALPPDIRIIVENDATAAAVYEAHRRLREHPDGSWKDFILVRVGTGIGVGLVLGGEVHRGHGMAGGLAGEFGHMTIVASGKTCACGNRGCWESYASTASAARLYAGDRAPMTGKSALHFSEIVSRAAAGERRAQATLERVGEYLGIGIGNVISGMGVAHVVVSGNVVGGWEFIRKSLHEAVARAMAGRLINWTVESSAPASAGLGGALEVAIEQYLFSLAVQTRAAAA